MDKETLQKMLERRGYKDVSIVQVYPSLVCEVGYEHGAEAHFYDLSLSEMTYDIARDYIDQMMGHEMRHVMHSCGQILLEANGWWSGFGPYNDFEQGFYLVPLSWGSKPVDCCPACQEKLSLEGDDLIDEDGELMDIDTYEEVKPTVLPRVDDPELTP